LQSLENDLELGRAERRAPLVIDQHATHDCRIFCRDQHRDVIERHFEAAQQPDCLGTAYLRGRVRAIARVGIDGRRPQQPEFVVMP
jgi:hypothetical protein